MTRRAFTLLELTTVLAAAAVIACVLAPTMAQTQSAHRLSSCAGFLRQLGQGMQSYTSDYSNRLPTFSWAAGVMPVGPDSPAYWHGLPHTRLEAAQRQSLHLVWRNTGLDMGQVANWAAPATHGHLVLYDYLGWSLLTRPAFCNEDRFRPRWLAARIQFMHGTYSTPPIPDPVIGRWPFSSSWVHVPAVWSEDGGPSAVTHTNSHRYWNIPGGEVRQRRINEVQYPANKVYMHDTIARHMPERWYYFAYTESRQPLLFFDLSVREKRTGSGNRGFNPANPGSQAFSVITYEPQPAPNLWEAPTVSGNQHDTYAGGYYRFTRSGLRGRDFDGPEVPWGQ